MHLEEWGSRREAMKQTKEREEKEISCKCMLEVAHGRMEEQGKEGEQEGRRDVLEAAQEGNEELWQTRLSVWRV